MASVDITPPLGYRMSGYFRERLSTGVSDPLFAKAIVLRQGSESAAMVFCDLIGLAADVTDRAREEAHSRTGIPPEHILVCATHSHTGPLYYGALRDHFHRLAVSESGSDPYEKVDYRARLSAGIAESIVQAQSLLQPVRLRTGKATQEGLAFNRRFLMKDGSVRFNPGFKNPDIVRCVGPVDPDVTMVFFNNEGNPQPTGALVNFALHLDTTGGTEYSADYPFFLQRALREKYGDEFILFFGTGTCGDINHLDVTREDRAKPDYIGETLAETVLAAESTLKPVGTPSLAVRTSGIDVPLQSYGPDDLAWAQASIMKVGTSELSFLDQVKAYRILDLHARGADSIRLEVQVFRMGEDLALVGFPGEVFVELGLAAKRASPFSNTLVVELCRDAPGYVPTRKAFSEGSYEIVNSRIAPGGAEKMVDVATSLLKELA